MKKEFMKNTKSEIGPYRFPNPELVLKMGLVLEVYKKKQLPKLWTEAEAEALKQMPSFRKEEFFYAEEQVLGGMIYSYRYYTPEYNRVKKDLGSVS